MMNKKPIIEDSKLQKFKDMKVMNKQELSKLFNCSGRTVQRKLNKLNSIRSYNKNGQYFSLKSVAEFNEAGIWCYNSICFSKHGNLTKTVIALVSGSSSGISASEICVVLKLAEKSFLTFFKNIPQIRREKFSGKSVYFSSDESIYQQQYRNRQEENQFMDNKHLTDTIIILILIEKIKNPEFDQIALSKILCKQGVNVSTESITELFESYGIKKNLIFRQQ